MQVADLVVIYPTYQKPDTVQETLPSIMKAAEFCKKQGLHVQVIIHACVDNVVYGYTGDLMDVLGDVLAGGGYHPFVLVTDNMSMADSRNMCLKLAIDRYAPRNILMLEEDHQFKDTNVLYDLVGMLDLYYGMQVGNGLRVGMVSGCMTCTVATMVPLNASEAADQSGRELYVPHGIPAVIGGSNSCFRAAPTSHWVSVLKGYDHDEYPVSRYQTRGLKFRNYHSGFTTLYFDGCQTVGNVGRGEGDSNSIKLWDEGYCASDPRSNFRGKDTPVPPVQETGAVIPPETIPEDLIYDFTLGGQIRVREWYFNSSKDGTGYTFYSRDRVQELIQAVRDGKVNAYGATNHYLYEALNKYPIRGSNVAIMGSVDPWYEAICFVYGGLPVTVEYNERATDYPGLRMMTPDNFYNSDIQFDAAVSISSFEHDGLGRYGDPVCPDADLQAMAKLRQRIKPGGILFLAVPVGVDTVVWNAHRIYGRIRLPLLIADWKLVESFGFTETDLDRDTGKDGGHQPVFVLKNNKD